MFSATVLFAAGLILGACEIIVPGFVIFWFGIGAVITGLTTLSGITTSYLSQSVLFALSSAVFLVVWFRFLKRKFPKLSNDASRDPLLSGIEGIVTKKVLPGKPGEIDLYANFHGITHWKAEASEEIESGEEIVVVEAKGITLLIKRKEK